MKKKEKKFNVKELLTFKNFIILGLIAIIIVMALTDKTVEKEKKESFEVKLTTEDDYAYCQRIYHYESSDMHSIITCDGNAYVSKNSGEDTKLEIENVAYIYNFLTISDNLIYFLTKNGDVYYLSTENLLNEQYTLEKLDLKEIAYITEFYIGKSKDDAFSNRIYAVDKTGKMHLIKSGN